MNFDTPPDRRDTHCVKWDKMEALYGVSPQDGLAMWVADMEYPAPDCIQNALREMVDHGVYGYGYEDDSYRQAIVWWMQNRHGWKIDPEWVHTTHGLVNAVGLCLDAYTQPGDGVLLLTPVYHAFSRTIRAAERCVVECEMPQTEGKYVLDFDAFEKQLSGSERMLILCSPHNPGGRVWRQDELEALLAFARRHELILVSDEIHQDLVFVGHRHIPIATLAGPDDRLVVLNAPSKTFNIAGAHTGHVIIPDADLRKRFAQRMGAMGISSNSFGLAMVRAVYSAEGASWVDEMMEYLCENRRIFDAGVAKIPGLTSMDLEATYLSWVDFTATGMSPDEITRRVQEDARIAANHGSTFGKGGERFMRFNIAAPRAQVEDAVARLQAAFADLQ